MSDNKNMPKRTIPIAKLPKSIKGQQKPSLSTPKRARKDSEEDQYSDESSQQESSSSELSSSVRQDVQESSIQSESNVQESSELSSDPRQQLAVNQVEKNRLIQIQSHIRQNFEVIMQHLLDNMPISNRASRLEYLLLQLKEGMTPRELIDRSDMKDKNIIAQHNKLLQFLRQNISQFVQKRQYEVFKDVDIQKIVYIAYSSTSLDFNLASIRKAILKQKPFALKQFAKLANDFVGELMDKTRRDLQSKNIKYVTEENQMKINLFHGTQIQKLLTYDPFSDFGTEKEVEFDQVSKYGIFCSKKEEEQMSKDGIFNYRLHRTMLYMQNFGLIVPQENIKLAKNLAILLIRLTDFHVTKILQAAMKAAKVGSRVNSQSFDEVAYFSTKQRLHQKGKSQYNDVAICKLKYPSLMKMYRELRTIEIIQEQRLHDNLLPEMMEKFTRGRKRLNKEERIVTEYYTAKPAASDYIAKLKSDTEKDPISKQKSAVNRIAVQPRHVKQYVETHPFYKNHQIAWRFNAIY